jgi:hypothetical protein
MGNCCITSREQTIYNKLMEEEQKYSVDNYKFICKILIDFRHTSAFEKKIVRHKEKINKMAFMVTYGGKELKKWTEEFNYQKDVGK